MTEPRRALIVGAGIGGLAAAVALRRSGWDIEVCEQAASPRTLGFGLLLAANALAALRELQVSPWTEDVKGWARGAEIRRLNGDVVRRFSGQIGRPLRVALRADVHGALLQELGDRPLLLDREVVSFAECDRHVTLTMSDGATATADVLIGADGVDSTIRRCLHPGEAPPRPSGFCAVRGVAYGVSDMLGELAAIAYLDDGIEAAAARASTDAVYWYMSLLAADVAAGERSARQVVDQRMSEFEAPFRTIVEETRADDMRFDELLERDPLPVWGTGRVTLLGDAAHPMLPHTGQGAAQALEDAVALGLALASCPNVQEGLRRYEAVRSRRTGRFVRMGPRIARVTTTRSRAMRLFRTLVLRTVPERLMMLPLLQRRRDPHRALRPPHTG